MANNTNPYILITNVYTYLNKGDAAIVISLIREIRRVTDDDIRIQTADVINDNDKYGTPTSATLLWILLSSVRDSNILLRLWVLGYKTSLLVLHNTLYSWLKINIHWLLPRDIRAFVTETRHSKFVIACGGGYLRTSSSSLENTLLLYITCLNFLTGHYLGKKVYLYSQSIGPVHGWLQHFILKRALKRVDIIESREDISTSYLHSLDIATPVIETADPVMLMGDYGVKDKGTLVATADLHVGLTVRKWFKTNEELEDYMTVIAKTIDYLASTKNAHVYYIPQVIATNFGDDDRIIARRVKEKVQSKDHFTVIEDNLSIQAIIGLCGSMDIFIGTRMHSNIFSLINHVPVVAIEYEHKTRGIMKRLGIEDMTLDINDITYEVLKDRVDKLIANHTHYKKLIQTNLADQMHKSASAIEIINEDFSTKNIR